MNYMWNLKDIDNIKKINRTVFSCFSGAGGSTMGYKLAGYDVIGNVEIDKKMMESYKRNNNPKYSFLIDIKEFNNLNESELPKELFNLDILDGSPPCTAFSVAGLREKVWGEEKKFNEGNSKQVIDNLFFDFINTIKKLKPKIVVAENVKGLIIGKAKGYVNLIIKNIEQIGYDVQVFLLDSSFMGVPQVRKRVFIIARRKDINLPNLKLIFENKQISFREVEGKVDNSYGKELPRSYRNLWEKVEPGESFSKAHPKKSFFNVRKQHPYKPCFTITATSGGVLAHYNKPNHISDELIVACQTFPQDYDFGNLNVKYACGMSVPPVMMYELSKEIYKQWLINKV